MIILKVLLVLFGAGGFVTGNDAVNDGSEWSSYHPDPSSVGVVFTASGEDGNDVFIVPRLAIVKTLSQEQGGPNGGPWAVSTVARSILAFVASSKLRGSVAELDTFIDEMVTELAPHVTTTSTTSTSSPEDELEPAASSQPEEDGSSRLLLARATRLERDAYIATRESPSQFGADLFALLRHNQRHAQQSSPSSSSSSSSLFSSSSTPFFVDAGCHNPYKWSNTWLLERNGWTGLAIDANPVGALFETRRRTRFVQALLWSRNGAILDFASTAGPSPGPNTGGGAGSGAGTGADDIGGADGSSGGSAGSDDMYLVFRSAFDGVVEALGSHKLGVLGAESTTVKRSQPTRTLAAVLDQVGAPAVIDFLSLDVEGSELEVLRVFPFHRYTFLTLVLEHNGEEPKRSSLRALMLSSGYVYRGEVMCDDVYEFEGPNGDGGDSGGSGEGVREGAREGLSAESPSSAKEGILVGTAKLDPAAKPAMGAGTGMRACGRETPPSGQGPDQGSGEVVVSGCWKNKEFYEVPDAQPPLTGWVQ